jgi:hypothetical protein
MSFPKALFFLFVASSLVLASCSAQPTPAPVPSANDTVPANTDTLAAADLSAILSEVQGAVEMKNPDQAGFSAAANGGILQVQGQVRTGADGHIRLDLSSGTLVRVAPDSLFTLESNVASGDSLLTRLKMEAGRIWIILRGGQLDVETPSGTASVRGSYLSVWVDPESNDVYLTCLEGSCQAQNDGGSMDFTTGEFCSLYYSDPAGSVPPPPPVVEPLTQDEIDLFLANNPEAQEVVDEVNTVISTKPTLTPSAVPSPVENCFTLTSPADGTAMPAEGLYTFDWTDQPGRYKYIVTITKPTGAVKSQIVWTNSFQIGAADLPFEGTYQWKVTAYDANIQPICTAGPWTFTKAASPAPTPVENCFKLLAPAPDFVVPASSPVDFSWEEQPGRYKFVFTLAKPDGGEYSQILFTNGIQLPAEKFTQPGAYFWKVTAYDSNIQPICSAGPQGMSVPGAVVPTTEPGGNGSGCVTLLTPTNGADFPSPDRINFTWTSYTGTFYKYVMTVKYPGGSTQSFIAFTPNHTDYFEAFPEAGTYEWWVTVKDNKIQDICTSGVFTFTKPVTVYLTASGGGGGGGGTANFWGQGGPTGTVDCSVPLGFTVGTSLSGSVKVLFSSIGAPNESSPHEVIGSGPGTASSALTNFLGAPSGQSIYWMFAVYDGIYHLDSYYYSFTCQ